MSEKKFIGYEYKDISVRQEMESVYADGYENFGWSLDSTSSPSTGIGTVSMKFKRDRKIGNKAELTRMERQFDSNVEEINSLEASKSVKASVAAFSIGIIGSAFMAGSVFAVTHQPPMVALCIILAIPGFLGWILPYFCYRAIRRNRSIQVSPLIEQKYDEIYQICKKANGLLG